MWYMQQHKHYDKEKDFWYNSIKLNPNGIKTIIVGNNHNKL